MRQRRAIAVALVAQFAAGCSLMPTPAPQPVSGRVKTEARDTYYDVFGATADELYAQMRAKGLRLSKAVVFGDYRWDLSWKFQYDSSWSGGTCRMTEVLVRLDAQAILPRWQPPAPATDQLRKQWAAFIQGLQTHEKGHAEIAARAAQEVKSGLQRLSAAQCDQMPAQAEQLARGLLKQHRSVDEQYDRDTRYGAAQGASWPPVTLPSPQGASLFHPWH